MAAVAQRETTGKSGWTYCRDPRTIWTAERHRPTRFFKVHKHLFQGKYITNTNVLFVLSRLFSCTYIFIILLSIV